MTAQAVEPGTSTLPDPARLLKRCEHQRELFEGRLRALQRGGERRLGQLQALTGRTRLAILWARSE